MIIEGEKKETAGDLSQPTRGSVKELRAGGREMGTQLLH